MLHVTLRGIAGLLLAAALAAQDWRAIGPANGNTLGYDWARGEFLSVGAFGETFAADATEWHQRARELAPVGWTLCHDPVRARTVALTTVAPQLTQVYEWDGATWLGRASAHHPTYQYLCSTYDSVHHEVLAFGRTPNYVDPETWAWNGTDWRLLGTAGPTGLNNATGLFLAFDSTRGIAQLVVVRAIGGSTLVAEFWEGDGVQWNQRTFANAPSNCNGLAYDPSRQRTVLTTYSGTAQTWDFDAAANGGTWQLVAADYAVNLVFARHRGRVVGQNSTGLVEWTGQGWVTTVPRQLYGTRMRLHPASGRVVSFGGSTLTGPVTAENDGFGWRQLQPAASPPARQGHAMWNDGHDVWLFGGQDSGGGLLQDTWRWDGNNWAQVMTPQAPSPRHGVAVAYDSLRQRAVAFGGSTTPNTGGGTAQTWEFDGATWLLRSPTVAPPARSSAAAGYDPIAARTMVCLGDTATGFHAIDAWQWDGQQWTAAPPVNAYTWFGGQQHDLAFDSHAGRLMLAQAVGYGVTVKEFTGTGWLTRSVPAYLQSGSEVQLVVEKDGNLLLGANGGLFRRMVATSRTTPFGTGCMADLVLGTRTYPKLGAASGIETAGAPANGLVLLLAADSTTSIALGNGCTQLVPHTQWHFFLFADAFGVARLPLTIPDDIALRGYQLNFQALTLAAQGPGFAASAGLRLTLGD